MSDESGYLPKWIKTAVKAVKKAVSSVVNKAKSIYNNVKTKVVSIFKSAVTKNSLKGFVQGAGDNIVGQAISK